MQFLVNKTGGVVSVNLGYRVGGVTLSPYESIPVELEKWDATALNAVRLVPTQLAITEKVPKKIIEARKLYLKTIGEDTNSKKEELESKLKSLQAELEEINTSSEQLETEIGELEVEYSDKQVLIDKEPDNIALQAELSTISEKIGKLKMDCTTFYSTKTRIEKSISDIQAELETL